MYLFRYNWSSFFVCTKNLHQYLFPIVFMLLFIRKDLIFSVNFRAASKNCSIFGTKMTSHRARPSSWIETQVQVILFEIDCTIFYTNLHELFCHFISWTNWVNSGKFMDNCWISCQVMADMKKVYNNLIIINL